MRRQSPILVLVFWEDLTQKQEQLTALEEMEYGRYKIFEERKGKDGGILMDLP